MTSLLPVPNTQSRMMRLCVLWFALAMLLSQSLGQLHAIKHGGRSGTQSAVAVHDVQHAHGFLEQLFSSHSNANDCKLYDQLSDSHAMPAVALMALPVVLPSLLVAIFEGEALARWAALFDARGPPLTF